MTSKRSICPVGSATSATRTFAQGSVVLSLAFLGSIPDIDYMIVRGSVPLFLERQQDRTVPSHRHMPLRPRWPRCPHRCTACASRPAPRGRTPQRPRRAAAAPGRAPPARRRSGGRRCHSSSSPSVLFGESLYGECAAVRNDRAAHVSSSACSSSTTRVLPFARLTCSARAVKTPPPERRVPCLYGALFVA